jgi:hypothetical protein
MRSSLARRCILPALALILTAAAAPPPPEEQRMVPGGRAGFVTDGAGGCWVWAGGIPAGSEAIMASWTGPCPEGPADGDGRSVISWKVSGRERQMIYEGPLSGGKAQGRGTLTHYDDGQVTAVEDGEFRDDYFARGRIEIRRNGLVYEGEWRRTQPHGHGRVTLNGQTFEGEWENGCLRTKDGWLSFTRPAEDCEGRPT